MATLRKEAIRAHGLTERQMNELALRKQSGEVEMIPANLAHKIQDPDFASDFAGYKIPMHERFMYHVALEHREYSRTQRNQRESVANVQVFDSVTWQSIKDTEVMRDYTREIIHNPELEEKDAPLVTLYYTLTDEELKEIEEAKKGKDSEPKKYTVEEVSAITNIKEAFEAHKAIVGKYPKKGTELQPVIEAVLKELVKE